MKNYYEVFTFDQYYLNISPKEVVEKVEEWLEREITSENTKSDSLYKILDTIKINKIGKRECI